MLSWRGVELDIPVFFVHGKAEVWRNFFRVLEVTVNIVSRKPWQFNNGLMDWLTIGVQLSEITTAHHLQQPSRKRQRPPPTIHRAPLPIPLVPSKPIFDHPARTFNNTNTTASTNINSNLLATTTALRFLIALSESPRLRLECDDSFIQSLHTITNILSRTVVTTVATNRHVGRTHDSGTQDGTPTGNTIARSHATIDLQKTLEELHASITQIAMQTEEADALCALRLQASKKERIQTAKELNVGLFIGSIVICSVNQDFSIL